jgi:hypothetical protein
VSARSTIRVPIFGKSKNFRDIDPTATYGAVFGKNLYNSDGTLVTVEQFQTSPGGGSIPSGTYEIVGTAAALMAAHVAAADPHPGYTTAAELATAVAAEATARDAAIATAVTGLWDVKGGVDCSANPNYPAALKGDAYVVTVAGKIGGASGTSVEVGDVFVAFADNAGGTEAAVGASWENLEHNLAGALTALSGDVTTPGGGSGVATIANDAVTNAKAANMAAGTIKARKTASTGDPEDCTLTEVINANIASVVQGDILYYNGTSWTRLGPGTSGEFLKTQGAGANPVWATPAGASYVQPCFWDYLSRGSANMVLTAGLLKVAQSGAGGWFLIRGTRMRTGTGKYYFECKIDTAGAVIIGITTPANNNATIVGSNSVSFGYRPDDGLKYNNNAGAAYGGITATTNDIIGCAIDFTNGKIYWAKNNVWINSGDPAAGTNAAFTTLDNTQGHYPSVSTAAANVAVTARFKSADLTYTPPTGFSAWES